VNDDGSIAWDWELPGDDSTWTPWMHPVMTKATQANGPPHHAMFASPAKGKRS
jgi:hypothetical protein